MTIHEFGKENKETIILIHPSVVKWDYFENVIPLLEKNYHLLVPALCNRRRNHTVSVAMDRDTLYCAQGLSNDDDRQSRRCGFAGKGICYRRLFQGRSAVCCGCSETLQQQNTVANI